MDFLGKSFFVEEFNGLTSLSKIDFEKASFWVRMFNLSLACMNQIVGFQSGSSMGTVEEVDTDEEGVGWGEYLRVKIKMDLSKPLFRGRMLKLQGGESVWIAFQYECLPKFCFHCEAIRHGTVGCVRRPGS